MKRSLRQALPLPLAVLAAALVTACHRQAPPSEAARTLSVAPPASAESGPVTGLADVPSDAVVFDLSYRVQRGSEDDVEYRSFWGYGGSETAAAQEPFIQEVRKRANRLHYVPHFGLKGRQWSALEYERRQPLALYFDLNADGKLADNERIPPTRKTGYGAFDFITPDFMLRGEDDREVLFRVLLQASFYDGSPEPNCMWSPACVLEGTASLNEAPARLVLFANGFDGAFDRFGSSSCALLVGTEATSPPQFLPRKPLSSLVRCSGQFYRLQFQGQDSRGHVARAVLTRDATPIGMLAVRLAGTNDLRCRVNHLSLHGVSDRTVCFTAEDLGDRVPVGTYSLERGEVSYGRGQERDWRMSFSKGPQATVEADKTVEVALGQPTLTIRAVNESERYNAEAKESAVFKKGTTIYFEPRIVGSSQEVLTRFRRASGDGGKTTDAPPKVRITSASGKELLAKTMEYG